MIFESVEIESVFCISLEFDRIRVDSAILLRNASDLSHDCSGSVRDETATVKIDLAASEFFVTDTIRDDDWNASCGGVSRDCSRPMKICFAVGKLGLRTDRGRVHDEIGAL
ncbi:hypothetical protein AR158_c108L [Paramecium bursaria Chlorella virus AR158]|uniref:hypothetical protein n=1 Tax=Paramecium bursaria Chlorella virus AR158 TaxID=380598 RepID=UPI00015AA7B2|nr:hypothetical protein AR158_c108L [Paramecium bursaria Chlorella virus AR158]ABU43654.1 hypothetical protein AR158_c108L [Paramecium bursaria Chlorella virus AR158]